MNELREIRIKRILKRKSMSQVELCQKVGMNKDYINRFIKGHHDITLSRAKRIADALGITLDELVGNDYDQ